jgi:hypothetical protein
MTLEHIYDTLEFMQTVRRSIGKRRDTLVFFQVPDLGRILHINAFWDIYYEHCSYFTSATLRNLFQMSGFEVVTSSTEYDGQYLQIVARPATQSQRALAAAPELASMSASLDHFTDKSAKAIAAWNNVLREAARLKRKIVLWGSGSKAVSFLSAMEDSAHIEYVVDINPYRQGHFMAGTAQTIVPPEFLADYKPDVVLVMNPIYRDEIQHKLADCGCTPQLLTV